MKNILVIVSIVFIVVGATMISNNHDKKVMAVQDKYNQCVEKEYGVSVASWYEENGSLPECN